MAFFFGRRGAPRGDDVKLRKLLSAIGGGLVAWLALSALTPSAQAIPSFARQTGQPCAACHTAFPELTPFGRRFKLSGYTMQGGDSQLPPIAAMLMPGYTHLQSKMDAPPPPGLKTNDNFVTQQVTGLYGGKVYGDLGAFIQVSGNPVTGQVWFDASDARYVTSFKLFGKDTFFGIDANNTPTVQDAWNTVDAWSFPQLSSAATAFSAPGTHIGSVAQRMGGVGAYMFWNDVLYAEVTAYGGFDRRTLQAFGMQPGPTPDTQPGVQPYWRLALEPHWGDHYLMVGTFGMYGQTVPSGIGGTGVDRYLDVGFDSQYQYDGDKYSVTIKLTDTMERQKLSSSFFEGASANSSNQLNFLKVNASFVWDHTYSLTGGYFKVSGSSDAGLYGANSVVNSPNSSGYILDAAYLPFSHGSPGLYSSYNARLGLQYIHYNQLYGGTNNFDGMIGAPGAGGTHNASGNNTFFAYAWIAF